MDSIERAALQAALDALDRLLGTRFGYQRDKIAAPHEIEAAAKRIADGIERRNAACSIYKLANHRSTKHPQEAP